VFTSTSKTQRRGIDRLLRRAPGGNAPVDRSAEHPVARPASPCALKSLGVGVFATSILTSSLRPREPWLDEFACGSPPGHPWPHVSAVAGGGDPTFQLPKALP